jgi:hypothetical protein
MAQGHFQYYVSLDSILSLVNPVHAHSLWYMTILLYMLTSPK